MSDLRAHNWNCDHLGPCMAKDLMTIGFTAVKGAPYWEPLRDELEDKWHIFFMRWAESSRMHFAYDRGTQSGYFPLKDAERAKGRSTSDIKKYFHYFLDKTEIPAFTKHVTPAYFKQMEIIGKSLLTDIQRGLEGHLDRVPDFTKMVDESPNTMLRLLHYPMIDGEDADGAIRAAAHTDINILTVLPASSRLGLQIKSGDGWIPVPSDPSLLIINAGDMMSLATEGKVKSTVHRVVNPKECGEINQARYSFPLFVHAHPDVEFPDGRRAGEVLNERLRILGVL